MSLAPAVISDRFKMSSDWELVTKVENEHSMAYNAQISRFQRAERNWKAFTGLDGGAWTEVDKLQLSRENREAQIYNICYPKVSILAGSLQEEVFDWDWHMPSNERNKNHKTTDEIKDTYYIDKEAMNYDDHINNVIRDGCVYAGEAKLEEVIGPDGLPRIAVTHKNPAFILRDPYWISDHDEDCESMWEIFFLSAADLIRIYKAKGDLIHKSYEDFRRRGGDYREDFNLYEQIEQETKGHLFRVIEHHWLRRINTSRLHGRRISTDPYQINPLRALPLTEDETVIELYIKANQIDPNTIIELPFESKVHEVTTVCPSLVQSALLENKPSKTQVRRLPYYRFSTLRANGEDMGVVDTIIHAQRSIDRRESKIDDLVETAQGGGLIGNADAFPKPEDRANVEGRASDPSAIFWAEGEEFRRGDIFQRVRKNDYPAEVINQLQRMYDVIDRISGVPAAMESMSESSTESGKLYEKKLQTAKTATRLILGNVKKLNNNLAEGYFYQWQLTYSGPERTLESHDGKRKVTLNKRIPLNNKIYVTNIPRLVPRCSAIVTETDKSPTRQLAQRMQFAELFEVAAKTHPAQASVLFSAIIKTFPDLKPEVKAKLERLEMLQEMRDISQMTSEIAQLDANTKMAVLTAIQSDMQLQSIMNAMMPQDNGNMIEEAEYQETSDVPPQGQQQIAGPQMQGQSVLQ